MLMRWIDRENATIIINWYMFEPVMFYLLSLLAFLFITALFARQLQRSFTRPGLLSAPLRKVEHYGTTDEDE